MQFRKRMVLKSKLENVDRQCVRVLCPMLWSLLRDSPHRLKVNVDNTARGTRVRSSGNSTSPHGCRPSRGTFLQGTEPKQKQKRATAACVNNNNHTKKQKKTREEVSKTNPKPRRLHVLTDALGLCTTVKTLDWIVTNVLLKSSGFNLIRATASPQPEVSLFKSPSPPPPPRHQQQQQHQHQQQQSQHQAALSERLVHGSLPAQHSTASRRVYLTNTHAHTR